MKGDSTNKGLDCINQARDVWSVFKNSTVAITGATGLIGAHFVGKLIRLNEDASLDCHIVLFVRNIEKAVDLFGKKPFLSFVEWDMDRELSCQERSIDYFLHAASPTSSQGFLDSPVEVIDATYFAAKNVLDFSTRANVRKILFLSTMEVYGEVDHEVSESEFGSLDPMVLRNCYPESKRLAECLCASFAREYGTHSCVLRLAQTFGPGVSKDDKRVFAEFARNAIDSQDIVLFSDGKKRNSYLSLDDAIEAIAFVFVFGADGEAYNAANNATYCSIFEMAEMVLRNFGGTDSRVLFGNDEQRANSFRKSSDLRLDTTKLESLGWKPTQGLEEMYRLMIGSWEDKS